MRVRRAACRRMGRKGWRRWVSVVLDEVEDEDREGGRRGCEELGEWRSGCVEEEGSDAIVAVSCCADLRGIYGQEGEG